MRDPFPIAPPAPLVAAVKPLADYLSLSTLPLHAHEVIFAFALYSFIGLVVSPALSSYFCGPRYRAFSSRTKINWNVYVVSFCQACIICSLSLYIILFDKERKEWTKSGNWETRIWGYSGLTGLCQSFALGYFLWDFIMCSVYVDIFGWAMLAHAVSAVSVFSLGYRPFCYFYCPVFLLYELSSPFLNIHWFCDKLDLTGSTIQAVNGGVLTISFFLARILWGQYSSYNTFSDMYAAYAAGHSTPSIIPGADGNARIKSSGDIGMYYASPASQERAFMGELYLPLWLPAIYLASNLVLNALNVWWFYKMVATIRKRFDPPWGTQGIGPDAVHYMPLSEEEKNSIAGLHKEGLGSVKAGRVKAEQVLGGARAGAAGTTHGAAAADVDVQRGVYADGHKSVEVTSTTRRSARSRRKA
ncbi:hypothetical protein LTR35_013193 [Friedmanniomyces endolithicus]|nr:hypothetical protein LTR35_013193 [Friedmanniomyces endolithicus]KAK0298471.1 hypothetical protein LTS00_002851 [Friedmanniomyces endolithicus]KAK0989395.1 hypothetical protein LTR54_012514 [Friedmanniomyces endolithicus]